MKCPQCGFRNLPGTKFCGACGADLTVQSSTTLEPFYPPRAWGRRFRQPHPEAEQARYRWRRWLPFRRPDTNPTLTLQQISEQRRLRRLIWLTALRSLAGLIPGIGLLRERRSQEGWRLLFAFLICIAIAVLCWRNFLSNIALLTIAGLVVYSVGATFFAAWQRNNLPTLSPLQRAGIWLTVVSSFFWALTVAGVVLSIWFGTAFVPFGNTGDAVMENNNLLLYSRIGRHLTNLKPNDYVVVDGERARTITQLGFNYGDVVIQFGTPIIARIEAVRSNVNGVEVEIAVPMFLGSNIVWAKAVAPMEAIQGKVIAVLNPPSRRRWLP